MMYWSAAHYCLSKRAVNMGWLIHAPRPGANRAVFTRNCQAALGRKRRWDVTDAHRRWRAARRWAIAVGAALAVFFVLWWAWYEFRLPPAGTGRLAVALPVAAVVSAALSGPLFFWAGQPPRRSDAWLSFVPAAAGWVDRAELAKVVSALAGGGSGAVALTTGLVGAGGFGKTTLAARACAERRVRRRFRGGIVWVTVGRDADGPGLAARIAEVIAAGGLAGRRLPARSRPGGRWPGRWPGGAGSCWWPMMCGRRPSWNLSPLRASRGGCW